MPTFKFKVAMDIRAYGSVDVTASDLAEAQAKLDAQYIADNFSPHGGGEDDLDYQHPSDIWIESVEDSDEEEIMLDLCIPDGDWIQKPPKLGKIGFFRTPKSTTELENYLELFSGGERVAVTAVYGMTWNLCAHLTNKGA